MIKKSNVILVSTILLALILSGCSTPANQYPDQGETKKDSGVMEGFDKTVQERDSHSKNALGKQAAQQDDFSLEMKHWKYGVDKTGQGQASSDKSAQAPGSKSAAPTTGNAPVRPVPPASPVSPGVKGVAVDSHEPLSVTLLTVEDLDKIIDILVQMGYLPARTRNKSDFIEAITNLQRDHNINPSGELDAQTMSLLNNIKNNPQT